MQPMSDKAVQGINKIDIPALDILDKNSDKASDVVSVSSSKTGYSSKGKTRETPVPKPRRSLNQPGKDKSPIHTPKGKSPMHTPKSTPRSSPLVARISLAKGDPHKSPITRHTQSTSLDSLAKVEGSDFTSKGNKLDKRVSKSTEDIEKEYLKSHGNSSKDHGVYTIIGRPPLPKNDVIHRLMSRALDRADTRRQEKKRLLKRQNGTPNKLVSHNSTTPDKSEETSLELIQEQPEECALSLGNLLKLGELGSQSSLPETNKELERRHIDRKRNLEGPGSSSVESLPRLSEETSRLSSARTPSAVQSRRAKSAYHSRPSTQNSSKSNSVQQSASGTSRLSNGNLSGESGDEAQAPRSPSNKTDLTTFMFSKPNVGSLETAGYNESSSSHSASSHPDSPKGIRRESCASSVTSASLLETQSTITEAGVSQKSNDEDPSHSEDGHAGFEAAAKRKASIHSWASWPQDKDQSSAVTTRRPGDSRGCDERNIKPDVARRHRSAMKKMFLTKKVVIFDPKSFWDKLKIEEKISIDTLESLKTAFHAADVDGTGQLELDEFKTLLKNHLNLAISKEGQIDALFQKIDWASEGAITWDEFCTYMQLEYAEKEDSYLRAKEVAFNLPAKIENMQHREPVLRITDTQDGMFIACSQDGLVTFWSGQLDLKRVRTVVTAEQSSRTKPKWITDFCLMSQYNKLIVGTGDREIQFFELSSFEPYCQISGLETVPLKLDYCSTGHDECVILYGDSLGCINIIVIGSAGECLRMWKNLAPKAEGIPSVGIDVVAKGATTEFIRWKVHGDWVQQLKYYHNIRQVISCSNHANTALVIGCTIGSTHVEQQLKEIKDHNQSQGTKASKQQYQFGQPKARLEADQSVFKVYKGVKCFDFSKHKNIIITGGMDRIVRIWNPYVPGKPTGMLRGHSAPIFYLFVAEEENRIFSISTDLCIKIWDIQDQNCLLTVRPKGHKIRGDLQACHYSNISKSLAIATDQMNGLPLRLKPSLHADIVITHKEPINSCIYNPSFKQIITCADNSVIKVWDFETGNLIFEYGDAHGDQAITCMAFDNTGRRLLTGGRDGYIKIWNYNNGHCLKTMMKEKDNEEICALTYVEMNKNRYVVAVGWDKRINIYNDAVDGAVSHVQYPIPKWADDINNGHKEDILSVAQSPPNLLATSGYDGEIIVWNMVSGHIFCHLNAEAPEGYKDMSLDGDLSINKLTFLKSRACSKEAATLVASGPRGHIHFWNVFSGGSMMARFPGSKNVGAMVSTLEVLEQTKEGQRKATLLFSSDSHGFIYVWNIDGYCLEGPEAESPELLLCWRGHVQSVTCMTLVEETRTILSASLDCTVRVWTFDGEYVGTFGQPDTWDIYNMGSYQHPMVPYDVLIDPMSLPDHPVLQDKQNTHQVIHEDSARNSDDEERDKERRTPTVHRQQQFYVGDVEIAEEVRTLAPSLKSMKNKGKRLRHEQKKPIKIDRGGPSEYRMLTCYSLDPTPTLAEPKFKLEKDSQFDFFPPL